MDTEFLKIAISIPRKNSSQVTGNDPEKSLFHNYSLEKMINNFQLKAHYAKYQGGYINASSTVSTDDKYYDDYKGETINLSFAYFMDLEFTKASASAKDAHELRTKTGKSYFDSFKFAISHDDRFVNLPKLDNQEIMKLFNVQNKAETSGVVYLDSIDSQTLFVNIGYYGLHLLSERFFYNFSLLYGSGQQQQRVRSNLFQTDTLANSSYNEVSMGIGYLMAKRHHIGIKIHNYTTTVSAADTETRLSHSLSEIFYRFYL